MCVSRSINASLLSDYAYVDHAFTYYSHTIADVKRYLALYARHRKLAVEQAAG